MSDQTYLCQTDGTCPTHGPFIYHCHPCHIAWEERNPHTTAAVARFASGKGSRAAVDAARKQDRASRHPHPPAQEVGRRG